MGKSQEKRKSEIIRFWAMPLARPWKTMVQVLSYLKLFFQVFVVFTSMITLLVIPSLMVYSLPPHRRVRYFGPFWRIFTWIILRIGVGAKVITFDRRQDFNSPFGRGLYVANHLSMIDIPLLAEHHIVIPLMKKEVAEIPIFGKIIEAVCPITVDRKDPGSRNRAFNECVQRLKTNWPVQYYPEGTRSKTGVPKPFEEVHVRLIETAFELQVPVTPISIYGTSEILGQHGDIKTGETIGMITHDEMLPENFENAEVFSKAVWAKVHEGYGELKKIISDH